MVKGEEKWYTQEECNTNDNIQLWHMYNAYSSDKELAISISENLEIEVSWKMFTNGNTLRILADCSEHFKYIGIDQRTPKEKLPAGYQHVVVGELKEGLKKSALKQAPHIFWRAVKDQTEFHGRCGRIFRATDGYYKYPAQKLSPGLYKQEKGIWHKQIIW